jgi:hypothetical protein
VVNCTVLKYVGHGSPRDSHNASSAFARDVFRAHVQFIKDHRFRVIGLDQVARAFSGGGRVPERAVAISFEGIGLFSDAIGDIVKANELPVTVFVDPRTDDPEQLRGRLKQLRSRGVLVGHHVVIERSPMELLPVPTEDQVTAAKQALEQLLDEPVDHAAYAFDVFLGTERKFLGRLGYKTASTVATAMAGIHLDPHSIRQCAISEQDDIARFGWKLWRSGAKPAFGRGAPAAMSTAQTANA